jgi:ComF family protein
MGRWLAQAGADLLAEADLIVPVPLHRWRLLTRRFNQAAMLAAEVSRLSGVPARMQLLERTRRTPPQVGRTRDQRQRNVQGAFRVRAGAGAEVEGQRIVLVDDVMTTGATLGACARALKRAGAERIDVLVLALVTDLVGERTADGESL